MSFITQTAIIPIRLFKKLDYRIFMLTDLHTDAVGNNSATATVTFEPKLKRVSVKRQTGADGNNNIIGYLI